MLLRAVQRRLIFVCVPFPPTCQQQQQQKGNPTTNARNCQFLVCLNDSFSLNILFHKKNTKIRWQFKTVQSMETSDFKKMQSCGGCLNYKKWPWTCMVYGINHIMIIVTLLGT